MTEMGRSCRMRWDRRGAYCVWVGKPEGKRPLGRPGCGWEDNVKMDLQEVGWSGLGWGQVSCAFECGNEYSGSIKCGEPLDWLRNC
jgi:hypothetical protein